VSETYVCARCEATVEREFAVKSLIRTCAECGEHGRFVHKSLLESLTAIPDEERPEEWDGMSLDDQFMDAVKRGLIEITRG
jgi:DNA-directed RNA polymerase subunit RPC12/RpoP